MPETMHQTVKLSRGKHSSPQRGACVMELASMLAGEPFSDRPDCVCPVLAGFLRVYNDQLDDDRRQDLFAYEARVVGSRSASVAQDRDDRAAGSAGVRPGIVRGRRRGDFLRSAGDGPLELHQGPPSPVRKRRRHVVPPQQQ